MGAPPNTPDLDAYSLYLRTRSAVSSAAYPQRIAYTIAITGDENGNLRTNHYRANCDPVENTIRVFPMSDEQLAEPEHLPQGINFYVQGHYESFGRVATPPDLIGVPVISPTYMFGLTHKASWSAARDEVPSKIPTIAIVSSQPAEYRVASAGGDNVNGIMTDHLILTPIRDPQNNRLRDLWVSQATYLPVRASISGNFTTTPLVNVPWTVDFSTLDGAPYVTSESADGVLSFPHNRSIVDLHVAFENVHEQSGLAFDSPLVDIELTGAIEEPKP